MDYLQFAGKKIAISIEKKIKLERLIQENKSIIDITVFDSIENMSITVVLCCMVNDIAEYLGIITKKDNSYRVMKFIEEKIDYYKR